MLTQKRLIANKAKDKATARQTTLFGLPPGQAPERKGRGRPKSGSKPTADSGSGRSTPAQESQNQTQTQTEDSQVQDDDDDDCQAVDVNMVNSPVEQPADTNGNDEDEPVSF